MLTYLSIPPSIHPSHTYMCMLTYMQIQITVFTHSFTVYMCFYLLFIFSDRMTFRRFRKHGHHTAESSHRNKETHLQLAEFPLFGFHVSGLWAKPAGLQLIAASWRGLQTKGRVPSRSSSLPIFTTACILGRLWQIVHSHFIRLLLVMMLLSHDELLHPLNNLTLCNPIPHWY